MSNKSVELVKITLYEVNLPFLVAFKHNLASRKHTINVIVQLDFSYDNKIISGFGESVPREYVSNETSSTCLNDIKNYYIPLLKGFKANDYNEALNVFFTLLKNPALNDTGNTARCAVELAFCDGIAKIQNMPVRNLFITKPKLNIASLQYGAVVPYLSNYKLKFLLYLYKFLSYRTIKIKVGANLATNLNIVKLAREILGPLVTLRIDANSAWTVRESIEQVNALNKYNIASVEEPCTGSIEDIKTIQDNIAIPLIADESLVSIKDAHNLIGACRGFNIRISKNGGISSAIAIAQIAYTNNIECHLGAQVGESNILFMANQHLAFILANEYNLKLMHIEGAGNNLLLKNNLSSSLLSSKFPTQFQATSNSGFGALINILSLNKYLLAKFAQELI